MATTYNGWQVVNRDACRNWHIPGSRAVFPLLNHPAGFVLACFLSWFNDSIERIYGGTLDDWGWAPVRVGRGLSSGTSNHCSGTAADVNALWHAQGKRTFSAAKRAKIALVIRYYYRILAWGGFWRSVDEMHTEIKPGISRAHAVRVAFRLAKTARGKRVLAANPEAVAMLRRFA